MIGPHGRRRHLRALAIAGASVGLLIVACSDGDPAPTEVPPADARSGGDATVYDDSPAAFSHSATGLDSSERQGFAVGNAFFNDNWVIAPSSTEGRDGLGPVFNAVSCSACHLHDGRSAPTTATSGSPGLLIRLSRPGTRVADESTADPVYGEQLSDQANPGVPAEGTVSVQTRTRHGTYGDGSRYSLEAPSYTVNWAMGEPRPGLVLSPRVAPALIGAGLLEAIPERDIRAAADPMDEDGDGISGRAHDVRDPETGRTVVGRFGWKAGQPTVQAQAAAAFQGDIGITSTAHPDQPCTATQTACRNAASGGEPELDDQKLERVTFYNRTLAVPARRGPNRPAAKDGAELFAEVGCAACHTPTHTTGPSDIEVLARQEVHPYTDLLLHDMGPGLADAPGDVLASGPEWRTAPLWGIGLVETVSGHTRFLHDGRARSLEEAVLWHGGEGSASKRAFAELPATDRRALITFLESL